MEGLISLREVFFVYFTKKIYELFTHRTTYLNLAVGKAILGIVDIKSKISFIVNEYDISYMCNLKDYTALFVYIDEVCIKNLGNYRARQRHLAEQIYSYKNILDEISGV